MRVLHIIDSAGMYGAENMLLGLVEEQIRQGIKPVLASIGEQHCGEKPIEVEARKCNCLVKTFRMRSGLNFSGACAILSYARSININLLHSHGYKGDILFGFLPRRVRKFPLVSTVHGWTATTGFSKLKIYEWLDSISLRFVDAVVLVNKDMLNLLFLKQNLSGSVHVIDNGITNYPTHRSSLRKDIIQFCEGNRVIGAIGRLSEEKGFIYLIDAFRELHSKHGDLRLLILGEGPQRESLEKIIDEQGTGGATYMPGYVQQAYQYLPLFDVVAMPSISEGLPITLLEAMREGVLVIASAVGGIPDALGGGSCGILIPPCDKNRLTDALATALIPNGTISILTARAKKRFTEIYSSARMCSEYIELYRKLLLDSCTYKGM